VTSLPTTGNKQFFGNFKLVAKRTNPRWQAKPSKKLRVPNVPNTRWRYQTARGKATVQHPTFGTRGKMNVATTLRRSSISLDFLSKHSSCQFLPSQEKPQRLLVSHLFKTSYNQTKIPTKISQWKSSARTCLRFIHRAIIPEPKCNISSLHYKPPADSALSRL